MRNVKGYMTIEASFVIPMVICIFMLIIYFSNYLYTSCILCQDSYILAFRAAGKITEGQSPENYVDENKDIVSGKKYFGSTKPEIKASVSGKKVIVSGKSDVFHGAMGGYFLKPKSGWAIKTSEYAIKKDYSGHVRTIKRLKDIISKE